MNNNKKISIPIIIAIIAGIITGIFGVMVSIFSDGTVYERIITVLIVLIIYGILSLISGLLKAAKSWIYSFLLILPGIITLIYYTVKEFKIIYLLYIVLILLVMYFGTKSGKTLKRKKY